MMNWIKNNIAINNWRLWVSIALVVKITMAIALILLKSMGDLQFYFNGGDTINYIEPLENLFTTGQLYTNIGLDKYQLRMPGFMPLYLPLRTLFSQENAMAFIVLIQVILSAVGCYLLAVIASRLTPKRAQFAFVSTFVIFTLSSYASYFDIYILSESLTTSLLIIIFYLLSDNFVSTRSIAIVSLLLVWLVFLKPYFVPLIGFLACYVYFRSDQIPPGSRLRRTLLLIVPYILVTLLWATWNYQKHGDFVILQKPRGHWTDINSSTNPKPQLQEFVRLFGGQYIAWDPKGHVFPFFQNPKEPLPTSLFPEVAFTTNFNRDSLEITRKWFYQYLTATDSNTAKHAGERATSMLLEARNAYMAEHTFDHYFGARIRCFLDFFFQNAAYNIPFPPFESQSVLQKLIKVIYTLLFWSVMTFGLIELVRKIVCKPKWIVWLLGAIPGFLLLLFPIVLLKQEQRYAVAIYVFLVPFAVSFMLSALNWIKHIRMSLRPEISETLS